MKIQPKFYDIERDGVTQSLLMMWLSCREKARLYLAGWDSKYHSPALTFGTITHGMLELAYLDVQAGKLKGTPSDRQIRIYSNSVEAKWKKENTGANKEALKCLEASLAIMERTVPIYFSFWADDFKNKTWVSLEEQFTMPVKIKNVIIPFKGKRDGLFKTSKGIWLMETKTKAMINEGDILETLGYDFQVLTYLLATWQEKKVLPRGVLYNIIRKTSLKEKAGEDVVIYAKRIAKDIEKRPEFYFIRLESPVSEKDLLMFKEELTSILWDFYEWYTGVGNYKNTASCVSKYGKCSFLSVCSRGDFDSLIKRKTVFKELEEN